MDAISAAKTAIAASPFGGILQKFLGETFNAGASVGVNPIEAMVSTIDGLPVDLNIEIKTASSTISIKHTGLAGEKK